MKILDSEFAFPLAGQASGIPEGALAAARGSLSCQGGWVTGKPLPIL